MNRIMKGLWKVQKENKNVQQLMSSIYNLKTILRKKDHGKKNKLVYAGAFLKKVTVDIIGDNNSIIIKHGTRLKNCNIYIRGSNNKLIINKNCTLRNSWFWFEDLNCEINIGEDTTSEGANIYAIESNSKVTIGKDCMISFGVDIRTSDSHSIIDLDTDKIINPAKDINIGEHVWLCENVQILKGVNILNNSIVGAKSLVTKDVIANSVYVGIPAKLVRSNINWLRERV